MKNLLLLIFIFSTSFLLAQDITGEWNGVLDINGIQLRVVFHVEKTDTGFSSTMDSPDQGATGIATTSTTFEDKQLNIIADALRMNYEGQLAADGSTVNGTFKQSGMSFPLELKRGKVEKKETPARAQEPKEITYTEVEMKIKNSNGGHELAGTLTMPKDEAAEALVILVSGSGPQDRNEDLGPYNHRPFLVLSDYLTRNGVAVFRYDDRGVGESGGDFSSATTKDFADDASAIVDFFSENKMFNQMKIGIVGHSEGGMIAPIAAVENGNVDFIVLLAGPGIPIKELMSLQVDGLSRASGATEEMLKINADVMDKVYSYIINNKTQESDEMQKALQGFFEEAAKLVPEENKEEWSPEIIKVQTEQLSSPWFRYFAAYDPADYLTKVKCPVLAVNGTLDLQVTSKENLAGIEKNLKEGGNKDYTIKAFDQLNHLFQTAITGSTSEYGTIEETFNEDVMKYLLEWIDQRN